MDEPVPYREWTWVKPLLPLSFCLIVARGLDPGALADRLAVAPEREMLTRDEAVAVFGVAGPVVRLGVAAGWAFGCQEYGAEAGLPDALCTAATGTEAVTVWRTASALSWFGYARDGDVVTAFELDSPYRRSGTSPDGLIDVMTAVGLPADGSWPVDSPVSPVLAGLALLTALTGVRLTEADIEGPLLTGELAE